MKHPLVRFTKTLLLLLFVVPCSTMAMDTGSLLGMLTNQLGVTQTQAEGGAAAMLSSVKDNLSQADYGRILKGSPDLASLPAAADTPAPSTSTGSSSWGGIVQSASSMLGGESQTMKQAANLAKTFDGLGLSPEMVGKFGKVMVDYVRGTGGTDLASLFAGALPI